MNKNNPKSLEELAREYAANFLKERIGYINQMLPTEIIRMSYNAGHAKATERVQILEQRLMALEDSIKELKEILGCL